MNRIQSITIRLTEYATEPVTLEELKLYLQVEGTAYDDQLTRNIVAARGMVEQATNTSLTDHEIILKARIDKTFRLPLAPVDAVTDVRWRKCPAILEPKDEGYDYWIEDDSFIPDIKGEWVINYTTTASDVPQLAEAVLIQAGHLYTYRDQADKPSWDSKAEAIVNAYKAGNY